MFSIEHVVRIFPLLEEAEKEHPLFTQAVKSWTP